MIFILNHLLLIGAQLSQFEKYELFFAFVVFSIQKVTETTTSKDVNGTTTMAPFKITRNEFNKIIRRNLRGLVRLFNIELEDALKVSKKYYAI